VALPFVGEGAGSEPELWGKAGGTTIFSPIQSFPRVH